MKKKKVRQPDILTAKRFNNAHLRLPGVINKSQIVIACMFFISSIYLALSAVFSAWSLNWPLIFILALLLVVYVALRIKARRLRSLIAWKRVNDGLGIRLK